MVAPAAPRQIAGTALAVAAHLVGIGALAFYLRLPDVRPLEGRFPETTAYMRQRAGDADGAWRSRYAPVPLDRISPNLVRAVLVAEDAAFYRHRGVDWYELRQAVRDALSDRPLRGASTITQQLARNLYLSSSRSLVRKLEEFLTARRLERTLSKGRILELYLNVAEWGPGVFGAEAAAWAYYGIPASQLDVRQAAELAATLPHPRTANPARNPEQLRWRTTLILNRLRARGWAAGEPEPDTLPPPEVEGDTVAAAGPPPDSPAPPPPPPDSLAPPPADSVPADPARAG